MPGLPNDRLNGPVFVVSDGPNPSTAMLWNCFTAQAHVTMPPARMVTAVGLNVSALALTVALPGAPTGGGGVAGASVGGTAVGGMGVAVLCGAVGAVVATPVALAVAVATVAAAVALSGAVVAGGFAAEDVPRAVEVAEAKIGVVLGEAWVMAGDAVEGPDLLSEPPHATRAIPPIPTANVASVFT